MRVFDGREEPSLYGIKEVLMHISGRQIQVYTSFPFFSVVVSKSSSYPALVTIVGLCNCIPHDYWKASSNTTADVVSVAIAIYNMWWENQPSASICCLLEKIRKYAISFQNIAKNWFYAGLTSISFQWQKRIFWDIHSRNEPKRKKRLSRSVLVDVPTHPFIIGLRLPNTYRPLYYVCLAWEVYYQLSNQNRGNRGYW